MTEKRAVNREHKDRLFKLIFREKEDLLELYNAINHTEYTNAEEIEVNTLEDAIYMNMKNDISFVVKDILNLYEHQSTFSPNLPLRGLFYFAELYQKIIGEQQKIYGSRLVRLPYPQFVVFYNGTREEPEYQVLQLHDAYPPEYEPEKAALQCRAVVLNINYGHNPELLARCRKLREYAALIAKIREMQKKYDTIEAAVDAAVEACIREGILEDILRKHRKEVVNMIYEEFDEQGFIEMEKEFSREEGRAEGKAEGRAEGIEEGKLEAQKEDILVLLRDLGEVSPQVEEIILSQREEQRLKIWLKLAARAESMEEFVDALQTK